MAGHYTLQITVLATTISLILGVPYPLPKSKKHQTGRGAGIEVRNPLIADLEKYVGTIPIKSLDGSALLVQYLDYLNGIVTFRQLDKDRQPYFIYNILLIQNVTKDKDVFVLRPGQDLIKVVNKKRQFVGMKRAGFKDKSLFFVFYIYMKDAVPGDNNKKTIGGKQYTLEIDFWDHRGGLEYRSQLFGWTACEDSIFIACKSEESKNFPIAEIKAAKMSTKTEKLAASTETQYEVQPGFDSNSEIDYFYDLDPSTTNIKYIRDKIDSLTRQAKSKSSGSQGRSTSVKGSKLKGKKYSGGGRGFVADAFTGIARLPFNIVGTVGKMFIGAFKWGIGLSKSFGGMFGGLGTSQATLEGVLEETIDEDVSEAGWLDEREMAALIAEVQDPTAGGMGGMITEGESADEPTVTDEQFSETTLFKVSDGLLTYMNHSESGRSFDKLGADDEFPDPMPKELVDTIVDISLTYAVDTFSNPGWKTLGKSKLTNKDTLDHEDDPFVGFGSCPYIQITADDLNLKTSPEEVLKVYMTALRTQCINATKQRFLTLVKESYLIIESDNSVILRDDLKDSSDDLIPISSVRKLGQALQFAAFSKILTDELRSLTPSPKSPDGNPISRSVFTLGLVVQEELEMIQKMARPHSIRLIRNILKSLQTFFIKLVQDAMILKDCGKCEEDKEINYNDKLYVIGLRQFIFRGLGPAFNGTEMSEAISFFIENNMANVEAKLKLYD